MTTRATPTKAEIERCIKAAMAASGHARVTIRTASGIEIIIDVKEQSVEPVKEVVF